VLSAIRQQFFDQPQLREDTMNSRLNIQRTAPSELQVVSQPEILSVAPNAKMLSFHPLAEVFPIIEGRLFQELVDDVLEHGVQVPIWLLDGQILDGRNRFLAARAANVDCKARNYEGVDPTDFVVSLNIHRRNLDKSQLAMVATKIARLRVGANQHGGIPTPSQGQVADMLGISRELVGQARKVTESGNAELATAVQQGKVKLNAALKVVERPLEEQAVMFAAALQKITGAAAKPLEPHVLNNSGNNEWYTPAYIVELARSAMGDIDTDPASCATANLVVGATTYFTKKQDGLKQKWIGRVWLNPPYSKGLVGQFAEAAAHRFESGEIAQACVLVNNATETEWFHRLMDVASAVCFPRGRIKFLNEDALEANSPLQGQAVLYLGGDARLFTAAFESIGRVLSTS